MNREEYQIEDTGKKRILVVGDKRYETIYSKKIVKLIIERKGLSRTPDYFRYKKAREHFVLPLFNYLELSNLSNLKVLEVGCSAGQLTELLNEQSCIGEIYTYDIDKLFIEIVKVKVEELNLNKVKCVDCFSIKETLNLPYENNFFDLILVSALLEHLPFENRHLYVDEYYRKLRMGGLICFLDTPNRNYPFERHSIGLPFISKFPPQAAFIYAKLFGRLKGVDFPEFVRAGTAWRNASYYECLPKALAIKVTDISEDVGYGYSLFRSIPRSLKFKLLLKPLFFLLRYISVKLDFPISFFLPNINVVFKKDHNYES